MEGGNLVISGLSTLGFQWLRWHAQGHEVIRQTGLMGEGTSISIKSYKRFESAETKVSFMPTYPPSLLYGRFYTHWELSRLLAECTLWIKN